MRPRWALIVVIGMSGVFAACQSDGSGSATTEATTTSTTIVATSTTARSAAGGGGSNGGGGTETSPPPTTRPPTTPPPTTPPPTESSTTVAPADEYYGPYAVTQTQSAGGETISGTVCDIRKPFTVAAATKQVAWNFAFVPASVTNQSVGRVSYAYNIPSGPESHSATGTYKLSIPAGNGVIHLSLRVSDHTVFHGFDGRIPLRYTFDLTPAAATCP